MHSWRGNAEQSGRAFSQKESGKMLPIEEVELEWVPAVYGERAVFKNVTFKIIPVVGENPSTGAARTEYLLSICFQNGYEHHFEIAKFGAFLRKSSAKALGSWWLEEFCKGVELFTRESSCEKG